MAIQKFRLIVIYDKYKLVFRKTTSILTSIGSLSMKKILAMCCVLLTLWISILPAQENQKDFSLIAKQIDGGKVSLTWTNTFGDSVAYYLVFRTQQPVTQSSVTNLVRIDSTTAKAATDQPLLLPEKPLVIYQVHAKMKSGAARFSSYAVMNFSDRITITSQSPLIVSFGTSYRYQLVAASSNPASKLTYNLTMAPRGMAIDTVLGLITWTPLEKGTFKVSILVTSNKGGRAEQGFALTIGGPTGTVSGMVTDSLGKPLVRISVYVVKQIKEMSPQFSGVTDELGKYTISKVDTGTYIAVAVPPSGELLQQWYDGAASFEKATPIVVKENATITINFILKPKIVIVIDKVTITSQPVLTALVGVPYSYQVTAASSDPTAIITYRLSSTPRNMTIDTATGLIKWTPPERGTFKVSLVVFSNKGGHAEQGFSITINGVTGTLSGIVTDSTGKALPKINVKLYRISTQSSAQYSVATDDFGKYSVQVDTGVYYARAVPLTADYLEQWYDGATSVEKAAKIQVQENLTSTVNFKMKANVIILFAMVSGKVVDSDLKPIKEATVSFSTVGFSLNGAKGSTIDTNPAKELFDYCNTNPISMGNISVGNPIGTSGNDFRLDGTSEFVFSVRTNVNGEYSIRLPQTSFTIMASATNYYKMFYNNKPDLLTADILKLTKDTTKIDFLLKLIPSIATGIISGKIIDSTTQKGVTARVVLFKSRLSGQDPSTTPGAFSTDTDAEGNYKFSDLPAGEYFVFAMPLGRFTPAFYNTAGSTLYWEKAARILIKGNIVSGVNIFIKPIPGAGINYSSIAGSVKTGTSLNSLSKGTDLYPITGALAYALDEQGKLAGYSVTDDDGAFSITELIPGNYTVVIDKFEYHSGQQFVSTSKDISAASISIILTPAILTSINNLVDVPTGYILEQNYPNPFNPSTQISFTLPKSQNVILTIYNLVGQRVATLLKSNLRTGTYTVTWNGKTDPGEQLPSGMYLYTLTTDEHSFTKRMMMLK
ncbi:MAG: carboxypeptidase regulatory-like domain-containing protein [bacterium]